MRFGLQRGVFEYEYEEAIRMGVGDGRHPEKAYSAFSVPPSLREGQTVSFTAERRGGWHQRRGSTLLTRRGSTKRGENWHNVSL